MGDLSRPDWLPSDYEWQTFDPQLCDFCAATATEEAVSINRNAFRLVYWCLNCEDRAKAAICGGDDGDGE